MLLKLYNKNNNPADLQRIVDLLNDGGLIIYPTDTMYAIGCHGLKERAIERICRLKDIDPKKNNLSIICRKLGRYKESEEYARRAIKRLPDSPEVKRTLADILAITEKNRRNQTPGAESADK